MDQTAVSSQFIPKDVSIQDAEHPWAASKEEIRNTFQANPEQGLSQKEVGKRLHQFGPNLLREHKSKSVWRILVEQLKSLIILLLAVAAAVSFWYHEILEGWAILVVILINTAIGFFTEWRAVRSMEALFKLGKVKTRVRRNGEVHEIDAREIVPGDIVLFEGGDIITADLRIIEASKLQADESALTGESLPIGKQEAPVEVDAVVAERKSMLYKGTAVTRGAGEGIVIGTGTNTELGHISALVEEAEEEQTPLEERLDRLGYRLIGLTLVIALFVSLSGIFRGKEIFLMIETGIALAVAAIPEGLPIVATIALAKGMRIMARRNALISRLSSVETLGTTGIIFTDKTGTLTENRMTVTQLLLPDHRLDIDSDLPANRESIHSDDLMDVRLALETGALCNNASFENKHSRSASGDPLEVALLEVAQKGNIDLKELKQRYPEAREEAFDPEVKMMATWNETEEGRYRISVKGAPDTLLQHCNYQYSKGKIQEIGDNERKKWSSMNEELAAEGLRMIGLAYRETDATEGNPYEDLIFIGLVALLDPPRTDVKTAIGKCRQAGIRVVMVTGDQQQTAAYIAKAVGLQENGDLEVIHGKDLPSPDELEASLQKTRRVFEANIFARISPKQKLDLIELYQKKGHIVAMTGDGVNDAPALKKADIGIAMGQRGTQVAREAAHMVLTDDAFSSIVAAIEQGRVIFGNIRRFVYYLLSCNVSEVLIVGLAALIGTPLPILPLQILFLNLVTDVFPALALGMGEAEEGVMQRPPRDPGEPVLTRSHWIGIAGYGFLITAAVMGALFIAIEGMDMDRYEAVTISFLTLAFAQLWHVFNMRSDASGIFDNTVMKNNWVWGAILLCVIILIGAIYIPGVAEVLKITPPGINGWLVIIGMSIIPFAIGQLRKTVIRKKVDREEKQI